MTEPDVPSPCTRVCRMNPRTGLCEGCSRTIGEITAWAQLDNEGRRRVLHVVEQRRAALAPDRTASS